MSNQTISVGERDEMIKSRRLRAILGDCSEMHLWRLYNDERYRGLQFPHPIKIGRLNHWRLRDVRRWLAQQARKSDKVAA